MANNLFLPTGRGDLSVHGALCYGTARSVFKSSALLTYSYCLFNYIILSNENVYCFNFRAIFPRRRTVYNVRYMHAYMFTMEMHIQIQAVYLRVVCVCLRFKWNEIVNIIARVVAVIMRDFQRLGYSSFYSCITVLACIIVLENQRTAFHSSYDASIQCLFFFFLLDVPL